MKTEDFKFDLIERYLAQELSENEAAGIRERIQNDPEFARDVAWMKSFRETMSHPEDFEMIDQVQAIYNKEKKRVKTRRMALAAVLLLLLLAIPTLLLVRPASDPSPLAENEGIAGQAADPASHLNISFDRQSPLLGAAEDELEQAFRLINDQQREAALPLLESYLSKLPADDDDYKVWILAGKIYLEDKKDPSKAIARFDHVIASQALPKIVVEAEFYKAVALYKADNTTTAEALFRQVAEKGIAPWSAKAGEVLSIF